MLSYQKGEDTNVVAPSRPASPLGEPQQPELAMAESDAPAATTDNSSPVRGKAGTKPTRVVPTRSDDGQGLQDTAAAAGPSPAPAQLPAQAPAAADPEPARSKKWRPYTEPKNYNLAWLDIHQAMATFNREGCNNW
jgi:hypothetical protein